MSNSITIFQLERRRRRSADGPYRRLYHLAVGSSAPHLHVIALVRPAFIRSGQYLARIWNEFDNPFLESEKTLEIEKYRQYMYSVTPQH